MTKTNIGEFIAALRKSSGYTQQEVADRLGVSNKTVSSWETGASCPDISMLPAIAELFGVTCDELLRGERIPADEPPQIAERKREKALAFRTARYKNSASTAALVSVGLSAAGILLTLVLGIGANRSNLGFWIGTLFLLAAVLTVCIWCRRIRFLAFCGGEEESPAELRGYIFRMQGRALLFCAAAFGFILPHAFARSQRRSGSFFRPDVGCILRRRRLSARGAHLSHRQNIQPRLPRGAAGKAPPHPPARTLYLRAGNAALCRVGHLRDVVGRHLRRTFSRLARVPLLCRTRPPVRRRCNRLFPLQTRIQAAQTMNIYAK